MNKKSLSLLFTGAVISFGALCYYLLNMRSVVEDDKPKLPKNNKLSFDKCYIKELNMKVVPGTLKFIDVVAWFKGIYGLDKNVDTPFIAKAAEFKDIIFSTSVSKNAVLLGVYNEKLDKITHHLCIETDAIDEKTKEIMGIEPLVVLQ